MKSPLASRARRLDCRIHTEEVAKDLVSAVDDPPRHERARIVDVNTPEHPPPAASLLLDSPNGLHHAREFSPKLRLYDRLGHVEGEEDCGDGCAKHCSGHEVAQNIPKP